MKAINFTQAAEVTPVVNATSIKVSPVFVAELKNAFRMFPTKADMRFKQDPYGRLIITVTVIHLNGRKQTIEGFGDADLIPAITAGMGKDLKGFKAYEATEHDVEVAAEGEDLVVEILSQYLNATTQCYIEKDWESSKGERYRKVTFTPSFNMHIKFCLKATDEVNNLIMEACKPEWMKKAELEEKQQEEQTA